jgi:hypothetical protein
VKADGHDDTEDGRCDEAFGGGEEVGGESLFLVGFLGVGVGEWLDGDWRAVVKVC